MKKTNGPRSQGKKRSPDPLPFAQFRKKGGSSASGASRTEDHKTDRKQDRRPPHRSAKAGKAGLLPSKVPVPLPASSEIYPLNKYLAHCGICARRAAVEHIRAREVRVNGEVIEEPGFKVSGKDRVEFRGAPVRLRLNPVYILLNKPKGYITTTDDPQERKTVMELVSRATRERVYPVGRLDRATTGLLLLTNDGDLAQQLSHPSGEVRKVYHISLDKPLARHDFEKISTGMELEDGPVTVDGLAYEQPEDKTQIGIELHSGRNRIVRRIFEKLGYEIKSLDRVLYAGLTKKNLPRGKWRMLTEKEVILLKHLKSGKAGKPAGRQ
jgi:23S rRNA pseudouridine2605 synthase